MFIGSLSSAGPQSRATSSARMRAKRSTRSACWSIAARRAGMSMARVTVTPLVPVEPRSPSVPLIGHRRLAALDEVDQRGVDGVVDRRGDVVGKHLGAQ